MSVIILTALSRIESPSGVCRGAVSTANAIALLSHVNKIYLIIGDWQAQYYTNQLKLTSDKIEVIGLSIANNSISRNKWTLSVLPKLVRELNAKWILLAYPMPIIKMLFPTKCHLIVIIHDLYAFSNPENFGYPSVYANQLFMRLCITNVDHLIFVSHQTKLAFYSYFPKNLLPAKVIHWYSSININKQQRPNELQENQNYILMIAQHRKNKNIALMINTFYYLIKNKQIENDTKLFIIGNKGPETNMLQQLVEDNCLNINNIHFISTLTDPELAYMYQHSQLVVCPSSNEGFGFSIVESASFGKTIICSDIPIFREIGNRNCIYFSLNEPVHLNLANAIVNAIVNLRPSDNIIDNNPFHEMQESYKTILTG